MTRRRRGGEEEHENHERWLVSYADFITLLFAFFVVMYSISSLNEGKYRVLSDALMSAFHNSPGNTAGSLVAVAPTSQIATQVSQNRPAQNGGDDLKRQNRDRIRNMAREIRNALAPLVKGGRVRIMETSLGILVEINASVLFLPGDAGLEVEAARSLAAVARILAPVAYPVTVEGHTDNTPIANPLFPSNWELSGARASSVVRLMADFGVNPRRLTATGYADQRPVADNSTTEGRARNRRVAIIIESQMPNKPEDVPVDLALRD